jgi:hypothetical protein
MKVARRVTKREARTTRRRQTARRTARPAAGKAPVKRKAPVETPTVMYRVCKSGWAVVAEKVPSAPDTRFVCPFCPRSHRVPGPVRGFRRVRRPKWLKLRRVFE